MPELTEIKGVSDSRAETLVEEGFVTVDHIASADEEELEEVPGIGSSTSGDLIDRAQDLIREETLDSEEDDATEDDGEAEEPTIEDTVDDEVPDLEGNEVTEDDVEELVNEDVEGEPDDEVTADDDEGEPEEVDVGPERYPVEINIGDTDQYDYFYYALVDMRLGRIQVTYQQEQLADDFIEAIRVLDGTGDVELTLTEGEMNALHAVLTQTKTSYQGGSDTAAFNAVREILRQVQAAREEYIL